MDATVIPDRIEREIRIEAPVTRVYELVSEPGWFIGDGERRGRVEPRDDGSVVVDFPPYGRFPVRTVAADPPRYVAFRGGDDPEQPLVEGTSTLVEFFITEAGGATLLRVVESGFAAWYASADRRAEAIEDSIEGWEVQLGFAKREAERAAT